MRKERNSGVRRNVKAEVGRRREKSVIRGKRMMLKP